MIKEDRDNILKRYEEGSSTLEEEKLLFAENDPWFDLARSNRIELPDGTEESIINSLDNKFRIERNYRRLFQVAVASVAVLLICYGPILRSEGEMSLSDKYEKLEEAKQLFADDVTSEEVIYEDEIIVISFKK